MFPTTETNTTILSKTIFKITLPLLLKICYIHTKSSFYSFLSLKIVITLVVILTHTLSNEKNFHSIYLTLTEI